MIIWLALFGLVGRNRLQTKKYALLLPIVTKGKRLTAWARCVPVNIAVRWVFIKDREPTARRTELFYDQRDTWTQMVFDLFHSERVNPVRSVPRGFSHKRSRIPFTFPTHDDDIHAITPPDHLQGNGHSWLSCQYIFGYTYLCKLEKGRHFQKMLGRWLITIDYGLTSTNQIK